MQVRNPQTSMLIITNSYGEQCAQKRKVYIHCRGQQLISQCTASTCQLFSNHPERNYADKSESGTQNGKINELHKEPALHEYYVNN